MKETYFYHLYKYKMCKMNLVQKMVQKKRFFLYDRFFIQIPIIWKTKLVLKKIFIFKMNIFQKLFLPLSISNHNSIISDKNGNGKIFKIIEKNQNFFITQRFINNGLVLISDPALFFQIYKILIFFSKDMINLLFMFILIRYF
ncbi:hypothetical protein M951_chr1154 (nucleomorph) [Lotharella oceanica]|uniref:Uncharacterized protein n=1 Tax=Lotharella oceanica TaxID=641309 RepID=A0A060DFM5_9EUKA|nr:hypothetical protein M951_chr1154 [Lotharella oceanica]